MAELEYFLVAQSVSTDQDTNRVSIFEVLEEIRPRRFPTVIIRFAAISAWNLSQDEMQQDFQVVLRIRAPGDGEAMEFAANFTATTPRQRINHRFAGFPLSAPGELHFELLINGEARAHHTVTIHDANEQHLDDLLIDIAARAEPIVQEPGNYDGQ